MNIKWYSYVPRVLPSLNKLMRRRMNNSLSFILMQDITSLICTYCPHLHFVSYTSLPCSILLKFVLKTKIVLQLAYFNILIYLFLGSPEFHYRARARACPRRRRTPRAGLFVLLPIGWTDSAEVAR